jgi:hypothetical protein
MLAIVNPVQQAIYRGLSESVDSVDIVISRSSESELRTMVQEDIARLRNEEVAVLEEGRGISRRVSKLAFKVTRDNILELFKSERCSICV